jgi:hypothetical protein
MSAKIDTPFAYGQLSPLPDAELTPGFTPPPVNRTGTSCPDYDRVVAMLFSGVALGSGDGRDARRPEDTHRIVPEWEDSAWQARLRVQNSE